MNIPQEQIEELLEQFREERPRSKKADLFRTLNSILLTIIILLLSSGGMWLNSMEKERDSDIKSINSKMDGLMVATLTNASAIQAHEINANEWKDRIEALENGQVGATADRITKTEALAAVDNLRGWVEKYYQRKK